MRYCWSGPPGRRDLTSPDMLRRSGVPPGSRANVAASPRSSTSAPRRSMGFSSTWIRRGNPSLLQADFQSVTAQHQSLFGRLVHANVSGSTRRIPENEVRSEPGFDGTHPVALEVATGDHRLFREQGELIRRDLHVSEERGVGRISIEPHPLRNHCESLICRGNATTPCKETSPATISNCIEAAIPTKSSLWNCTGSRDQRRSGARRKYRCGPDSSRPSTRNRALR